MQVMNGFPRKNPGGIHNSICMVRSVKRVTVSEKKSAHPTKSVAEPNQNTNDI